MDETITIRNGDFLAVIRLDELGELGVAKFRKLLKIAAAAPEENREAVERLAVYLPARLRGIQLRNAKYKTKKRQWEIFQELF